VTDPGPLKRILYPPDHGQGASPDGSDIKAVKRAISRAGFWKWQEFDDSYSNAFAHGGADGSGVSGFQRAHGIDGTGSYGEGTHNALRNANVPKGQANAGQDCFDSTAAQLYKSYAPPKPPPSPVEQVQDYIVEFCEKALAHPGGWYYVQNRPVDTTVDPTGTVHSDCSGSVIQIFGYAKAKSGLNVPDPAKQGWTGYGNTDYYMDDWPHIGGSYVIGDLGHYYAPHHVVCCIKPGTWDTADWWSFGSEPPTRVKLGYRSDWRFAVRPKLVA
jgi:hypothetical protein